MASSFFESLREILSIQRWNFMPRIDDWSEAENIAYYTHLAFAIAIIYPIPQHNIVHVLYRCLLKSYNKHCLSDIPISTRDAIKAQKEKAWENIIAYAAIETSNFFPRELKSFVQNYMQYEMAEPEHSASSSEEIIKFCQYQSALEECENNFKAFPIARYFEISESIIKKKNELKLSATIEKVHESLGQYPESIRLLKHVRRWNRLNRTIQSSVLAHTFIVSMLTLFFSKLENQSDDFIYESILRGLFHDVQESITGDIITPVKDIINKEKPKLWEDVEESMVSSFLNKTPTPIKKEIERYELLQLKSSSQQKTAESLVKECDRFALVLECAFERKSGNRQSEMVSAQARYINELRNSEWPRIREYAGRVVDEYS